MKGKRPQAWKAIGAIILSLSLIILGSYVFAALKDTFGRSAASVCGTDWISFRDGKISFYDDTGVRTNADGTRLFSFEEDSGLIKLSFSGTTFNDDEGTEEDAATTEWWTRVSDKELTDQFGLSTFYLYVPGESSDAKE